MTKIPPYMTSKVSSEMNRYLVKNDNSKNSPDAIYKIVRSINFDNCDDHATLQVK